MKRVGSELESQRDTGSHPGFTTFVYSATTYRVLCQAPCWERRWGMNEEGTQPCSRDAHTSVLCAAVLPSVSVVHSVPLRDFC